MGRKRKRRRGGKQIGSYGKKRFRLTWKVALIVAFSAIGFGAVLIAGFLHVYLYQHYLEGIVFSVGMLFLLFVGYSAYREKSR